MQSTLPPPVGLWLVGILYIFETVNLRLPRLLEWQQFSLNDVLDGCFIPLAAALLARYNFGPFGLSGTPFMLLNLRILGSGMHVAASRIQYSLLADVSRWKGGSVILLANQFHSTSHYLAQIGELGLLACFFWLASPRLAPVEVDAGLEMPGYVIASIHGLVAGTHAISTKTIPALSLVWIVLGVMIVRRGKALLSSVMRYAMLFCFCSLCFVIVWGAMHNGSWPTFEDANLAAAAK